MFTLSAFGIDHCIFLQVWVLKCPAHTATHSRILSVFVKMAASIKLKVLSLSDTTRIQSSCACIHQIFIKRQQLLYIGREWSILKTDESSSGGEKRLDLNLQMTHSSHLHHCKPPKPHMKPATHRRQLSHCMTWQTTSVYTVNDSNTGLTTGFCCCVNTA